MARFYHERDMMLSEEEVNNLPFTKKLKSCPFCGSINSEGHELCFHCLDCSYLQCCDNDGYYTRSRNKSRGSL